MRAKLTWFISRQWSVITVALMGLTLVSGAVRAQDEKDAEIAKLKAIVDAQKAQIAATEKAFEDVCKVIKDRDAANAALIKAIKDRDAIIASLENELKRAKLEATRQQDAARTAAARTDALLKQVRELETKLLRIEIAEKALPVPPRVDGPNPPVVLVNGKIEKMDGDLVQIDRGTDHGVQKNHTLDVYRLQPEPKYVGRIRIVDTSHSQSVGRLIVADKAARPEIKVGDLVTSKIDPEKKK